MKALHKIFSPDWFKLVCILVSICGCIPFCSGIVTTNLKVLHIYAAVVLLFDLLGERRILRNKGRFLLILFGAFYAVTLLNNRNLINLSGLSDFGYLLIALAVVYSYGRDSHHNDKITGTILCVTITVLNLVGIWMFFTKFFIYHTPTASFIGMYTHENRLCGLWGNPAVQGVIAFLGICLSGILFMGSTGRGKIPYAVMAAVNYVCMLLANARTSIICFAAVCAVFAFFVVLKNRKTIKGFAVAGTAALVIAVLVFTGGQAMQSLIARVDIRYDYYLKNIDEDYAREHGNQLGSNPSVDPTEPSEDGKQPTDPSEEPTTPGQTIVRDDSGLNGRGELWLKGLQLVLKKPLFGHGLNNLNAALSQAGYEGIYITGNLHNVYIDLLVACGLAGFGCFAAFMLIMFGNVKKFFRYSDGKNWNKTAFLSAAIVAFLLYGLVDSSPMFSIYPSALMFWYLFSQLAWLIEQENRRTGHYRPEILQLLEDRFLQKRTPKGKKICFVNDSLGSGGAERILLNITDVLAENGYDVTVLTLWSGGIREAKLNPKVKLRTVDPFDGFFLKRVLYWLNRHYMPIRLYNFLFLDGYYDYTVAFLEGMSTRIVSNTEIGPDDKKYAWVHIDFKNQNWVLPFYKSLDEQKASYKPFNKVFCVSEVTKAAFIDVIGCEDTAETLYNLIDVPKIVNMGQELCPAERPEGLLLCGIGRLNDQKGFDRLISAVAELKRRNLNVSLWILGEGSKRETLEKQIAELDLGKQVRLMGYQQNPYCYAAQADVFVLSSRAEGFGLVVTENLLLGNAVVATDCAGIREQLGDSEYGMVVENTEEALLEGLERILRDEDLLRHYSMKARERAKELSYETQVQNLLSIFS